MPLIFKLKTGGSSEEVKLITKKRDLQNILGKKINYLLEEFLPGKEFCATAIKFKGGIICLPIAEIKKSGPVFNKDEKYKNKYSLDIPAKIDNKLKNKLNSICKKCFKIFDCDMYTKIDIVLDKNYNPYVIEIDGIPGFGPNSILPRAAANMGISFEKLLQIFINEKTTDIESTSK